MSHSIAPKRKSIAGFTLAELIIVVSIMAILAGMTAPPIINFMQQRDRQQEQLTMDEIGRAIQAYLNENGTLPPAAVGDADDPNNWSVELAQYSNLSAEQMATDPWNTPRVFISGSVDQTMLNSTVTIWYASVHSAGVNRKAEGGPTPSGLSGSGIAYSSGNGQFQAVTNSRWWHREASGATPDIQIFSRMSANGDDMLMKFTDYSDKLARYEQTLERLDKISQALETYAKSAYGERVLACSSTPCSPTPEQQIFYPRSSNSGVSSLYRDTRGDTDLATYNGGSAIYHGGGTSSTNNRRRNEMINLMRILGLPDSYCCSALETFTYGGTVYEMPFYYSGNPLPRTGPTTCGSRPSSGDRKLPARLVTTVQAAGVSGKTPSCL